MNSSDPASPILRPATADDARAVAAVWHAAWRDGHLGHVPEALLPYRTLPDFQRRVPPRIERTTVATIGSEVVGFVILHDDELEQLFVDAKARGTGVATALMRHAEETLGTRYDRVWLAVAQGNARARRFYERLGWQATVAFDYPAEIPGGTLPVPCLRYVKRLRSGAELM